MEDPGWHLGHCACGSGGPVCCVRPSGEEEDEDRGRRIWSLLQVRLCFHLRKYFKHWLIMMTLFKTCKCKEMCS